MTGQIRNSIFSKFLWGIMGLYLLNISIDTADPNPEYIPEDLSINDQESIVEMVVENILGFKDAIREYDDQDPEDHHKKKNAKIDLLVPILKGNHHPFFKKRKLIPFNVARMPLGFNEIEIPPPKM